MPCGKVDPNTKSKTRKKGEEFFGILIIKRGILSYLGY